MWSLIIVLITGVILLFIICCVYRKKHKVKVAVEHKKEKKSVVKIQPHRTDTSKQETLDQLHTETLEGEIPETTARQMELEVIKVKAKEEVDEVVRKIEIQFEEIKVSKFRI